MSQTPGDGDPMHFAAHADRMMKIFMETYVPTPEKPTPRDCGTCAYNGLRVDEPPCIDCSAPIDGYPNWTPKPQSQPQPKPEASPLGVQVDGDHYKKLKIQPVEYIHANSIPFIEGSVIKYVTRWRDKGGVKDLEKARHFLDLLIELEGKGVAK